MTLFVSLSILFSGIIKGITAFGFNLLAVSALIFVLSPKVMVPVVSILSVISSLYLLIGLYKYIQIKRIAPLMAGAVAGIPLGVFLLVILKPDMLKALIGMVITVFALLFAAGYRREIKNEISAFLLLGLISGIIGGSTSLGGAPVILFFINQDCDKRSFRANLTLFYVMHGTLSVLGYLQGDLITAEVMTYVIILLIPMTLGILGGMQLVHRVNEMLFRRIALLILIVSGIASICTGLRSIF